MLASHVLSADLQSYAPLLGPVPALEPSSFVCGFAGFAASWLANLAAVEYGEVELSFCGVGRVSVIT